MKTPSTIKTTTISELRSSEIALLKEVLRYGSISTAIVSVSERRTLSKLVALGILARGRSDEGDARARTYTRVMSEHKFSELIERHEAE